MPVELLLLWACVFEHSLSLSLSVSPSLSLSGSVSSWGTLTSLTGLKWTASARRKYRDMRNLLTNAWNQILFGLSPNGMRFLLCLSYFSWSNSNYIYPRHSLEQNNAIWVGIDTFLNSENIIAKNILFFHIGDVILFQAVYVFVNLIPDLKHDILTHSLELV